MASLFTNYGKKINVLVVPVKIGPPFAQNDLVKPSNLQFQAIWDTGATHSCITSNVVMQLGLKPTRVVETWGVHGKKQANGYSVSMILPASVVFNSLQVTEAELGPGADVIIGMDVIQEGDFFVSSHGGSTKLHFQIPGQGLHDLSADVQRFESDYAKKATEAAKAAEAAKVPRPPVQPRNELCACGSGKKYKRCCGLSN